MTRALIRRVRREMHFRLGETSIKLKAFLTDEVKEIDDKLYPRAREHLQLFRTFLEEYYTGTFGQYPPPSIDAQAMVFSAYVLRTNLTDLQSLYKLLAAGCYKAYHSSHFLSQDRACVLQSIRSFDTRYNYENLLHPIPLVPDITRRKPTSFWRMSWPNRTAQLRTLDTLGSLSKATNLTRTDILENNLVAAYQQFEDDQVTFWSNDNLENEDRIEGRKIRWILIYAVYQTLLRATKVPLEVRDRTGAPYHLCISTADIPPWKERQSPPSSMHIQFGHATQSPPCPSSYTPEPKSDNGDWTCTDQASNNAAERPRSTIFRKLDANNDIETPTSGNPFVVKRSPAYVSRQPCSATPENTFRKHVVCENSDRTVSDVDSKAIYAVDILRATPAKPLTDALSNSSGSVVSSSSFRYSTSEAKTSYTSDTYGANGRAHSPIKGREDERNGGSSSAICGLRSARSDTHQTQRSVFTCAHNTAAS